MTSKSTPEQAARDKRGRFIKGSSGNVKGRPKGATCRALRQAREAAELYALPVLIEAVKAGDLKAATALVAYGLPRQKPMVEVGPVDFPDNATLTQKAEAVLEAVSSGAISGDAGKLYMEMLAAVASMKQADELEERVRALENQMEGANHG